MTDDILSLLKEADAILQHSKTEKSPEWTYYDITYKCLQCQREYKGKLFHPMLDPVTEKITPWCPRCLDEKLWWLHSNFEFFEVIETNKSVQNLNTKED